MRSSPPPTCTPASLSPRQRGPLLGVETGQLRGGASQPLLLGDYILSKQPPSQQGCQLEPTENLLKEPLPRPFPLHPSHSVECEHRDRAPQPFCSVRKPRQGTSHPERGRADRQAWLTHLQTLLRQQNHISRLQGTAVDALASAVRALESKQGALPSLAPPSPKPGLPGVVWNHLPHTRLREGNKSCFQ